MMAEPNTANNKRRGDAKERPPDCNEIIRRGSGKRSADKCQDNNSHRVGASKKRHISTEPQTRADVKFTSEIIYPITTYAVVMGSNAGNYWQS